jgi:NADP-dependent 3-hydroxy acid dehydrogenase YdfG
MRKPLIIVVGAGPGIGLATARRFGAAGYSVGLLARRAAWLRDACDLLRKEGLHAKYAVADVSNADEFATALETVSEQSDGAAVLLYNAARIKWRSLLAETAASLTDDFQVNVAGALTAVHAVLPGMQAQKTGTILMTGSMFDTSPSPDFGSLSLGKAALRNFSHSLAEITQDSGIHVAYLSIDGHVTNDDPERNPTAIAEVLWQICHKRPSETVVHI